MNALTLPYGFSLIYWMCVYTYVDTYVSTYLILGLVWRSPSNPGITSLAIINQKEILNERKKMNELPELQQQNCCCYYPKGIKMKM